MAELEAVVAPNAGPLLWPNEWAASLSRPNGMISAVDGAVEGIHSVSTSARSDPDQSISAAVLGGHTAAGLKSRADTLIRAPLLLS